MQRSQGTTQTEQSAPLGSVTVLGLQWSSDSQLGVGEEGRKFAHFLQQLFYFCLSVHCNLFTVIATGSWRRWKYIKNTSAFRNRSSSWIKDKAIVLQCLFHTPASPLYKLLYLHKYISSDICKKRDLWEPWGAADSCGIVSWGWHCLGVRSSALLFLYAPILLIRTTSSASTAVW